MLIVAGAMKPLLLAGATSETSGTAAALTRNVTLALPVRLVKSVASTAMVWSPAGALAQAKV